MIRPDMRTWVVRLCLAALLVAIVVALRATVFAPAPLSVRTTAVESGRVEQTVTNSRAGTVKARRRAKLSPENGGRIVELPHPEGSTVRAGDLLLRLDDALPRARLEVAEREKNAARAQREQSCLTAAYAGRDAARIEKLADDGIVSPGLLDQSGNTARTAEAACHAAESALERAEASVVLARTDLAKTVLTAPFAGVVAKLSIQVGEWTTPSPPGLPIPPVIDLIDPSSIYMVAPMDEVDSARMRAGQRARVTVDSHQGRSFPARLLRVAPYVLDVEAQNRTVEIELELDDAAFARTLLPGTSADAEVILDAREGVLRVPTGALMEGGRVLVLANGRLAERSVKVGLRNWNFTEIVSGLSAGELIVLSFDRPEIKAGARARAEAVAGS
jgi:HlyD family secretion protein